MRQFSVNRKTLSIVLCLVLISVLSLTVAYAVLSVTLNISGNADVVASNWNIHLDNPRVSSGSVNNNLPVISGNTMSFSSNLTVPGDYYEFTVDVVNEGTIDAMIDSVVITPTLTDSQKKYLRYEVSYQNGESITAKQLLLVNSSIPIKVRVEFRDDISVSDLPSTATSLNHKVTLVYSQGDDAGSSVFNDGKPSIYTSGSINDIGTIVMIGTENFYVIGSEGDNLKLLAMYNLYVGGKYTSSYVAYGSEATGRQDSSMIGYSASLSYRNGTTPFSSTDYWNGKVSPYPAYVYNSNSLMYVYLENYKTYLKSLGANPSEVRLISYNELVDLGCGKIASDCSAAPSWVSATSYWSGSAGGSSYIWRVSADGTIANTVYDYNMAYGVRPVVVIPRSAVNIS